ncbi:RNA polymerase sigma factor [Marinoscillum sp. MHG1-6]|uniref:RNA polymerase sigma factor n=1 Tax=Marinoscillum sp. MHG1-6 TaxID=2959627 RepID=UPI00215719FA|nr:sigma-70 family RNA polymerase sigma factor [Marinoscillum sp. MHG1-6]
MQTLDLNTVLIKRIKSRDTTALDYLYENYSEALFGIILRTLRNQEAAEETLHDVFIKIWDQIDKYDPSKGTLFTWMYRIARNQAIDTLRSKNFKAFEKSNDIDGYVDIFDSSDLGKEDYIGLADVLSKIGEMCKKLIQLNFFMGYSHAEISKNEDMPLGSVKTKLRSCLKNIRTQLSKDFG